MIFLSVFIPCLLLGAIVGLLAGMLGIGGGLLIVPVLVWLLPQLGFPLEVILPVSLATSLATIVMTSASATLSHYKAGNIPWGLTKSLVLFTAIGAVLGANLADILPAQVLTSLFAFFVICLALYMLFSIRITTQRQLPSTMVLKSVATSTGIIASLMGISGGAILIPYLTHCGVNLRHAIGVSTSCGMIVALFGTLAFMIAGLNNPLLPSFSAGYIYLPAVIGIAFSSTLTAKFGVKLASKLPVKTIKKAFAAFLICVAINMMI
ncbi:sulfite exporter TauE/SafE family protein [Thalassotalea aquiviva]|uniref:sulfite exporter TauE/SafE family protein n=1 Tax=Thalassotalea aquiviva TaxID=3242415 RepID=UPI00352A281B